MDQIAFEAIKKLQNGLIPTFLEVLSDSPKVQNWENFFATLFPNSTLGYPSEEAYLADRNLSVSQIIEHSIQYTIYDLSYDDISELSLELLPLLSGCRVYELLENQIPVYLEVINFLSYVKNIQYLLDLYKKPCSDSRGTAHLNSSLKTLIKSQIKMLSERLNGSYFNLQSPDEIEHTKLLIKFLDLYKHDEQRDFYELINLLRVIVGINVNILGLSEQEIKALDQISSFYNGMKTQPHELVRSVMLYASMVFDRCTLSKEETAEHILKITRFFFNDIFVKAQQGKKDKLPFTEKHLAKDIVIKTVLHQTIIYTYDNPRRPNFLIKSLESFIQEMNELDEKVDNDNLIEDDLTRIGLKMFKFLQSLPIQESD